MEMVKLLKLSALFVFAYMLGSIPLGYILTRLLKSVDIRQKGSRNIGATNVYRVAGAGPALITLAGDILKGAFPVFLAVEIAGNEAFWPQVYICLVAVSAYLGHLYPLFLKFRGGGKGVATAAGCFLIISPLACFISILVFIMMICFTNRASVGSLAAAAILPIAVWKTENSNIFTAFAVIIAIFIYYRHANNIRRLFSGTESVLWKKK